MPKLQILNLGNNLIENINSLTTPNLEELYIYSNKLQKDQIENLPKLKIYPDLSSNKDIKNNFPKLKIIFLKTCSQRIFFIQIKFNL